MVRYGPLSGQKTSAPKNSKRARDRPLPVGWGWRPCQKVNYVLPIDRPSSLQWQRKLQIFCLWQQATMGCCQQHAALACCMHGLWPAGYVSSKHPWLVASVGSHGLMPICHNSSKQTWLAA